MIPAVAAPVTALALILGYWLNRKVIGWLPDDPPRPGRKQHARPIPLAGITLLPVALVWLCLAEEWWLAGAMAVAALTGFADDRGKEHRRDLGWRPKALGLLVAAALAAMAVVEPRTAPLTYCAIVLFVFVVTNATNFLDNTDGVTCSLSAVSLLLLVPLTSPLAAVAFAATGFLLFNWPRPILFLGDAGAYLLGIVVATAAARGAIVDLTALGAVVVQLVDFVQVITARIVLGVAPWVGDRRHLTHIVQNLGVPRVMVAPLFAAIAWFAGQGIVALR